MSVLLEVALPVIQQGVSVGEVAGAVATVISLMLVMTGILIKQFNNSSKTSRDDNATLASTMNEAITSFAATQQQSEINTHNSLSKVYDKLEQNTKLFDNKLDEGKKELTRVADKFDGKTDALKDLVHKFDKKVDIQNNNHDHLNRYIKERFESGEKKILQLFEGQKKEGKAS